MYTKGQVIEFITDYFGNGKLSNGGLNVSIFCPFCNETDLLKKKLVIRTDTFVWHCWKCLAKGRNFLSVIRKFKGKTVAKEFIEKFLKDKIIENNFFEPNEKTASNFLTLPEEFQLLAENKNNSSLIKRTIDYVFSRGLTERDLWYFRLGITEEQESKYKNRVIIPSFDQHGKLNYFTTRAIYRNQKPKLINCDIHSSTIIFNELNIDWEKELTIVEGPFDLFKVNENATCLLGSKLEEGYLLFDKIIENGTPILLCLDRDAIVKTLDLAKKFSEYDIITRIFQLPESFNDVGEMKRIEFLQNIDNSIIFNADDYLKYKISLL